MRDPGAQPCASCKDLSEKEERPVPPWQIHAIYPGAGAPHKVSVA